eukprot:TRINITY_DN20844_c0_g1_i11.p1 TRINITY_DN20844_c0_g1~~TRINITY_DN20844_c0_g1_i11.p1  ORF type:complete len:322 (-),score=9.67 TRINITY_DN20844_c0_g1_i11:171-1136(-)
MLPVEGLMFDEAAAADTDLGLYFGDHDSDRAHSRRTPSTTSQTMSTIRVSDGYDGANDPTQAHGPQAYPAFGSLYPSSGANSVAGSSGSSSRISSSMSSSAGSSQSVTAYDDWPDRWCAVFVHGMAGSSSQTRRQLQSHLRDEKGVPVDWLFCSAQIFARWLFKKERGPHVKARCVLIVAWREVKPVAEVVAAVASGLTDRLPADPKRPALRPATDEHGNICDDSQGLTRHCISDVILLVSNSKRTSIVIETCQRLLTSMCPLHTAYNEDQVRVIMDQLIARPFVPQDAAAAATDTRAVPSVPQDAAASATDTPAVTLIRL